MKTINTLPPAIAGYFEAQNRRDAQAVAACFAPGGRVNDEGRTYTGPEEIAGWSAWAADKYALTLDPVRVESPGNSWRVWARATGQFPGSPLELRFDVAMEGEAIATLEVSA